MILAGLAPFHAWDTVTQVKNEIQIKLRYRLWPICLRISVWIVLRNKQLFLNVGKEQQLKKKRDADCMFYFLGSLQMFIYRQE